MRAVAGVVCISGAVCGLSLAGIRAAAPDAQRAGDAQTSTGAGVGAVTIVLPPELLANAPATLAVLGGDGHLAFGVAVDLGNGVRVTTDTTGRARFTAPATGALIATAAGATATALVDQAATAPVNLAATAPVNRVATAPVNLAATAAGAGTATGGAAAVTGGAAAVTVATAVSQHDGFAVCASGLRSDVNASTVTINGDPAFVLAASPECLVVLAQSRTMSGPAKIEVTSGEFHGAAATALVALDFFPPNPALLPGKKGRLFLRAAGTTAVLRVAVENGSPSVIHFLQGDTQELRTSGGAQNEAPIAVQAIRSGDFSFHARILPAVDLAAAARYLELAQGIAPKPWQGPLKSAIVRIEKHPRDADRARDELTRIAEATPAGPLLTLIEAARERL
jgi:hypothetical protein